MVVLRRPAAWHVLGAAVRGGVLGPASGVAQAPDASTVAAALLAWVRAVVGNKAADTRIITDTAGFDMAWLDMLLGDRSHQYLFEDGDGTPVYTDVLNVGSWYLGLGRECDPNESSKGVSRRGRRARLRRSAHARRGRRCDAHGSPRCMGDAPAGCVSRLRRA